MLLFVAAAKSADDCEFLPFPCVVTDKHKEKDIKGLAKVAPAYLIGAGDTLQVFVWHNSELSGTVPVRPDGRLSLPLVEDIQASGKTPFELARNIEKILATYIKEPKVTVIVTAFGGSFNQQVRVVGAVPRPQILPYREKMTVLDVIITAGGLSEFAAGNRSKLVRSVNGASTEVEIH
ncbi:MAG: polysaccharide biosynthesis/export family protein, partial [Gammaproteobacteria bacterium]|nr:polysaccharide biosynthesis/export family protein [Gammaproteobacteria bacterium]